MTGTKSIDYQQMISYLNAYFSILYFCSLHFSVLMILNLQDYINKYEYCYLILSHFDTLLHHIAPQTFAQSVQGVLYGSFARSVMGSRRLLGCNGDYE